MPDHRPLRSRERLRERQERCSRLGPEGEQPCPVRSNVSMSAAVQSWSRAGRTDLGAQASPGPVDPPPSRSKDIRYGRMHSRSDSYISSDIQSTYFSPNTLYCCGLQKFLSVPVELRQFLAVIHIPLHTLGDLWVRRIGVANPSGYRTLSAIEHGDRAAGPSSRAALPGSAARHTLQKTGARTFSRPHRSPPLPRDRSCAAG